MTIRNEGHGVYGQNRVALARADAVGVVGIGQGFRLPRGFRRCAGEAAAVRPLQAQVGLSVAPVGWVSAGVVSDRAAVDRGKQIEPLGIAVGVGLRGRFVARSLRHGKNIPGGVVGIGDGAGDVACGRALAVVISLLGELVLRVVLIGDEGVEVSGALGDARDVAEGVIGILLALEKCTVAIASGGRMPRRPQFSRPDVWNFFRNRAFGRLFDPLECQHRISTVP